jgi:hypothetical protein
MPKGGMQGVSGETTSQMLNRIDAIQSLNAKVIVVVAGTNDPLYGITPATTQSNLRKIYNAAIAAGMRVIAVTIMPRFYPNAYNTANESNRKLINTWIKSQTDVTVVDVENDVNDSIYFVDGLHNSNLGAYVVGSKVAAEINKMVAQCQPGSATEAQLAVASGTNPLMVGAGGKKDNANGVVANNWQLAGKFAGGAIVSGSKEVDASGREKQVIDISGSYVSTVSSTGSLSSPKAAFNNYTSSPFSLTTGDVVEGVAEIEITAPMVGISHIYLNVQGYTTDYATTVAQGNSMWPTSAKPNYMPPGRYVLRTPPITVGNNGTIGQLTTQIIIELVPTKTLEPVASNLKITSIGVVKLPMTEGPLAAIAPTGSLSVCPGLPAQLTAATGGGYSYQWNFNGDKLKDSTASTIVAKDPGSYTVTVSTNSCTAFSNTVAVTQGDNCQSSVRTGGLPATLCTGQQLTVPFTTTGVFEPGNAFKVQLSDGEGSFSNPTTIGSTANSGSVSIQIPSNVTPDVGYRIRVVSSNPLLNGSDNGQNIKIGTPPKAVISPNGNLSFYPNLPITLTAAPQGAYSYQWLAGGVAITEGGSAASYTPTASGLFRVVVTSAFGCTDSSQTTVVSLLPCNTINVNATGIDTTQFTFTATGGIPPYQYALDNGAYQSQNIFYGFQSSKTYTLTVKDSVNCTAKLIFSTKAAQSIFFASPGNKLATDPPFELLATASSGLPVALRVVSGPVAISGKRLKLSGNDGEVVIEASQGGNENFYGAPTVIQRFLVVSPSPSKATQIIDFRALTDMPFDTAPFALSATASSGLPVSYRVVMGPALLSGNILTISGTGQVVIEASQTGNDTYNPASPVSQSFTVNKASQMISFDPVADKIFGDAPFGLTATASSGLPVSYRLVGGPATISGNLVTITGAGSVSIEASQAGSANFTASSVIIRTFQISKAGQVLSFESIGSKTYGAASFPLNATTNSSLPVSYRVVAGAATLSGNIVSITGAGEISIEASQPGNENYGPATSVVQTFTISRASQGITFLTLSNKTFGDAPFALTATASSGLPVLYRVVSGPATVFGNMVTVTGTGTVMIEATQSGDVNYLAALPAQRSFLVTAASSVSKQAQTITFSTLAYQTFGNSPFTLTANASSGLPVSYRVVGGPISIAGNVVTITGSGTATIEAMQLGDATYNPAAPVQRSFTIGKAGQTITFPAPAGKVYSDAPFALTATSSSGLPVQYKVVSGPATIAGNMVTITGIGTVLLEAKQPGDANFNAAYPIQRNFIVTKGVQAITFPVISNKTNIDPPFALIASASSGLQVVYRVISGPATVADGVVTILGLGTVVMEAAQPGNATYNAATPVQRSFLVTAVPMAGSKLSQAITFDPLPARSFGDLPFSLDARASSGLPISFEVISGPAIISNNNVVNITGTGLVTIVASQSGDDNFSAASPVSQSFTVNRANQSIAFPPVPTKTYGDPAFLLAATATSGLPVLFRVATGPATITGNVVSLTGPGWVTIEAIQPGNVNYNAAPVFSQSFNVASPTSTKQNQTITFGTLAYKTYSSVPFDLTATASSGLPISYRVISGPITIAGSTVTITGVGTGSIEASQAGNATYNAASPVQRSFTIAKGTQTISFTPPATKIYGDPPFPLVATATSGLQVNFRVVSGPATIAGNMVTLTGSGTVSIEASQRGDANWSEAYPPVRNISVTAPPTQRPAAIIGNTTANGATTITSNDRLIIYPNPFSNNTSVFLAVGQESTGWLALYNSHGEMVKYLGTRTFNKGQPAVMKLDVTSLPSGTYLLRLVTNRKTFSQQIQVVK